MVPTLQAPLCQSSIVPTERVPGPDASLADVMLFATTTYFGYDRHGGVNALGDIANSSLASWRESGGLPASESLIRGVLFFEARRWHHFGRLPDEEAEQYIRALVEKLRVVTGGKVKVDRESFVWTIRRRIHRTD